MANRQPSWKWVAPISPEKAMQSTKVQVLGTGVIERQRGVKRLSGPGILFPGQLGIAEANVKFDRLGIAEQPFAQEGEGGVITCFVVELVGLFVVLVGAEKGLRHGRLASACNLAVMRAMPDFAFRLPGSADSARS